MTYNLYGKYDKSMQKSKACNSACFSVQRANPNTGLVKNRAEPKSMQNDVCTVFISRKPSTSKGLAKSKTMHTLSIYKYICKQTACTYLYFVSRAAEWCISAFTFYSTKIMRGKK